MRLAFVMGIGEKIGVQFIEREFCVRCTKIGLSMVY